MSSHFAESADLHVIQFTCTDTQIALCSLQIRVSFIHLSLKVLLGLLQAVIATLFLGQVVVKTIILALE